MIAFSVDVPPNVKRQIAEVVTYIADTGDVDRALAWEWRLTEALRGLGRFHGHAVDRAASDRFGQPVQRMISEGTYLIHYQVDDDQLAVNVINIRHGERQPHDDEP